MLAAVYYGPRDLRVEEVPKPTPGPGEVVVKVGATGICGSDLRNYRTPSEATLKRLRGNVPGHEVAGTVAELGTDVIGLAVGDQVAVEPLIGCGRCQACQVGKYHLCPSLEHIGGQRWGGFAEYVKAPARKVWRLPSSVTLEEGCLLDSVAVGVHAVQRSRLRLGKSAMVIGAGCVGLSLLQILRLQGYRVTLLGRGSTALQLGLQFGADVLIDTREPSADERIGDPSAGGMADVVFEAAGGNGDSVAAALRAAAKGGQIVIIGGFTEPIAFDGGVALRNELDVTFSWSYSTWDTSSEFAISIELAECRAVDVRPLITHKVALTDIVRGFDLLENRRASNAVKVVVIP